MNSYKELALYDMKSAEANYNYELWNKVGRECQQVCEKYLKYYLQENHLLSNELGRTHNLRKLMRAIVNFDKDICKDLSVVGGYYFEANYPGDSFIMLDREMADEAIETSRRLITYIDGLAESGQTKIEEGEDG
ncbi:MAG: HEPN domain-containing protein [Oscillospiraceae bacterium]|nr:HEPN domain-containing protein [Oscillospiraceae bacterium]